MGRTARISKVSITRAVYASCGLRITDEEGKPIKAEAGDGVINTCSLNDRMCLLEFDFECDTYKEWLERSNK